MAERFRCCFSSSCLSFPDCRDEHKGACDSKRAGNEEWCWRTHFPEQPADGRGRRYRQTTQQVIKPDTASAKLRPGKIHNHSFACWFTDLSQSSDDESDYQSGKIVRGDDRQRVQRKSAEGGDDKRASTD